MLLLTSVLTVALSPLPAVLCLCRSTLIKLITGDLTPKDGVVWLNPSISVAVFTQHHVDQLDLGLTPVELLRAMFPGTDIESCRRHLGRFGLGHDWSLIQIGNLSGGPEESISVCYHDVEKSALDYYG